MARILIIDDEPNIRTMVTLALQQSGHSVDSAADGPEGIAKFADGSAFDLVLLDQRMPEMEGLEVLKELRRRSPSARIIMITAYGTIDLAVDSMKAGATDFLRKPFTVETLRGAVQSSLASAAAEPTQRTAEPSQPLITYWAGNINGYSIEARRGSSTWENGDLIQTLTIVSPSGIPAECRVVVPSHVAEQIRSRAGLLESTDPSRFWRLLCEQIVANHLWQTPETPSDNTFRLVDVNKDLARWIDTLPPG